MRAHAPAARSSPSAVTVSTRPPPVATRAVFELRRAPEGAAAVAERDVRVQPCERRVAARIVAASRARRRRTAAARTSRARDPSRRRATDLSSSGEVAADARQQHLRLRIAETRVELDDVRPVGRPHQSAVRARRRTPRLPRAIRAAAARGCARARDRRDRREIPRAASTRPCRRYLDPYRRRRRACNRTRPPIGTIARPSQSANTLTSRPSSRSSSSTSRAAARNLDCARTNRPARRAPRPTSARHARRPCRRPARRL